MRWVQADDPGEPARILAAAGKGDWAATVAQLGGEARKTAATVRMSMSRALQFLADPKLAQSVLPGPAAGLDIAAFLRQRGTVYLIADSLGGDQAPVAALFAALVSEIRFQAAQLGSFQKRGRLDPPLFMALDEAPQICPVPVPAWVADSGGKGVQLAVVSQDEARMRERWGRDGAQAIWNCCTVKICLGGIHDPDTLGALSTLCGTGAYDQQGRRRGEARPAAPDPAPGDGAGDDPPHPAAVRAPAVGRLQPRHRPCPGRVAGAAVPAGRARRHRRGEGSARRGGPARARAPGAAAHLAAR